MKKILALSLAAILAAGTTACGTAAPSTPAGTNSSQPASQTGDVPPDQPVVLDMYQFKVEIVPALEQAIETYTSQFPNVTINLETVGGGGNYAQTLKVKMQSSEQPDIFNVGGLQEAMDYKDKLEDLSDQPWVDKAVSGTLLDVTLDGKVYGLPYGIEGYGLIYNKRIFEAAGIDAETLTTYDAIEAAVKDLDKRIKAGEFSEQFPLLEAAFEFPGKEGWVPGEHTMNVIMQAELQDPITTINAKTIDLTYSDAFRKLIDLQTLYTANGDDRSKLNSVDYSTQVDGGLAIERVAMIQQGNWISPQVIAIDEELANDLGMLPLPVVGYKEDCITTGVPEFWVVNKSSSDLEKQWSKHFLNWLYQSEEGKEIVVNDFMFIPPFTNYEGLEPADALSREVKAYADEGKVIPWVLRSFPQQWGREDAGGAVQRYLAGEVDWDTAMEDVKQAWADKRK